MNIAIKLATLCCLLAAGLSSEAAYCSKGYEYNTNESALFRLLQSQDASTFRSTSEITTKTENKKADSYKVQSHVASNDVLDFLPSIISAAIREPGDSCFGTEGVYDCDLDCVSATFAFGSIGDGFCDDGTFGVVLTCPEFSNDAGDCL